MGTEPADSLSVSLDKPLSRLNLFRWLQWQVVRRHPDYRAFCDSYPFDSHGRLIGDSERDFSEIIRNPNLPKKLLGGRWVQVSSRSVRESFFDLNEELSEIKRRFQLETVMHYSKDLTDEECLDHCSSFTDVVRIWPELGPKGVSIPEHGDFIFFGINIAENVNWKDIALELRAHIDIARAITKPYRKTNVEDKTRLRSRKEDFLDTLKIWDLHRQGKTAKDIILELWPNEYCSAPDALEVNAETRYKELLSEYGDLEDCEERAYFEAYGYRGEDDRVSGNVRLFMRVRDAQERMLRLFRRFCGD